MAKNPFRYEVDNENTVRIWNANTPNEAGAPDILQPFNPNNSNQPWASKEEATEWAKNIIAELLNPPVVETPTE